VDLIIIRHFAEVTMTARTSTNLVEVKRPTDGGILLRIDRSDPTDPVRDIHVWMPGFENARSPFHTIFVKRLWPGRDVRLGVAAAVRTCC
jgi:hypothetical protein